MKISARDELRGIVKMPISEQEKGWLFEKWLEKELRARGIEDAEWMGAHSKTPYDVMSLSENLKIQAKYTQTVGGSVDVRPGRPTVGSLVRLYKQSDFDVLAIYRASADELYFIRSADFQSREFSGMVRGHFRFRDMNHHLDGWSAVFSSWGSGSRPAVDRQMLLRI